LFISIGDVVNITTKSDEMNDYRVKEAKKDSKLTGIKKAIK
jgi:hypothetical protein